MKIGIVGSGFVGSATAFQLVMSGVAHEVFLIDKDTARAEAEAIDISHATPCAHNNRIRSGDYSDLTGSDIVIFTAGANQKPGQTRLDLLKINAQILKEIVPQVIKYATDAILLVASNPADIMTEITLKLSGLPKSRVICSGTLLDSSRFRVELSKFLGISSENINAYVLGEHGDNEVLAWSEANVGIMSIHEFAAVSGKQITEDVKNRIDDHVRNAAYKIIEGKRATFYGIAGALTKICHSIAADSNTILPVSSHHDTIESANNVCLAMPTLINRSGIVKVLYPKLDEKERVALDKCAKVIEDYTQQIIKEL
ncbi:MAG: L-lactate dehydrogenase [Puniceicoccales bacterium]|jgi:L-lactate dehydrogenase|nr:L-lactate dehydrogenase [Puniceicoccales bacterium]